MRDEFRPLANFETRQQRLAAEAGRLGLDGVLVFSWRRRALQWLTGYWPGFASNWAALWLPAEGPAKIGVRFEFDVGRARDDAGLAAVEVSDPLELVPGQARRIGLISGDVAIDEAPPALISGLASKGIEFVVLNDLLDQWRSIASAEDLVSLRWLTGSIDEAFRQIGQTAPVGKMDFEIAAGVEAHLRCAGVERIMCLTGVGPDAIVTEPSGAIIGADDILSLEVSAYGRSVCIQACHTIGPDQLSPASIAAKQAVHRCRKVIKSRMIPGMPVLEAVEAGMSELATLGFDHAVEYDFGHGVGVDTPELPKLKAGTSGSFTEGSVVVVHVALRDRQRGTWFEGGPTLLQESAPVELLPDMCWTPDA
jgi:Xaa-Pro aminopeptidase